MKDINKLTKDEKSLLLYFEDCLVNQSGFVVAAHMNEIDFDIAKKWNDEKFISFQRIPFHQMEKKPMSNTHWVRFTEDAWTIAQQLRKERSERIIRHVKVGNDD